MKLRPCLLVNLKTTLEGNASYNYQCLRSTADGARTKWESVRTCVKPKEYKAAVALRATLRNMITAYCAESSFGLLCREDKSKELNEIIAKAHKLANRFNAKAKATRINLYVITSRIETVAEANRAIDSEIAELIEAAHDGLKNNVKAARKAAMRAMWLSDLLSDSAGAKVKEAIRAARAAMRELIKTKKHRRLGWAS